MNKSKKEQKLKEWRDYLLHYECVRRNEEFKKRYVEWKRESEKENIGELTIDMLRSLLASQWGLQWDEPLPDPTQRPSLSYICKSTPHNSFQLPQESKVDPAAQKGMQALRSLPFPDETHSSLLDGLLVLNYYQERLPGFVSRGVINLRLSKKSIMKALEHYIDAWLKDLQDAGLEQRKPSRRIRLEEGITQLQVYDLRALGVPFPCIGATMFKGDKGDAEKKSKDHFRMAKRLIENPPLLPS